MIRALLSFALATVGIYLGLLGLASAADAPQSASPRRIGVLEGAGWLEAQKQAFRQGLQNAGYAEGRDVVIEWRSASGDYARIPELVADLVQREVEVIVATTTREAQAAKHATATIPIVMAAVSDPVGSGGDERRITPGAAQPGRQRHQVH